MSTFSIGFWELVFLAESCIPPNPIARSTAWINLINVHYHAMNNYQRGELYRIITNTFAFQQSLKKNDPDAILFDCRYNPQNQYVITTPTGKEHTFFWQNNYYTHSYRYIQPTLIQSIKPLHITE